MTQESTIEIAKRHSAKDMVLWIIAIIALICATLVNQYLPAYWQEASNVWVRIGVIVALVVVAVISLALTQQGRAFKTLLSDSRVELRRVTWPNKQETTQYTWQVVLVTAILALIVWILDTSFGEIIRMVIG